ncbi:MAG: tRNA glutamyl-Q(34) synthetase GluQRS [Betaproteobacteria bacterium]|nr:MAG: tRNA glutamyl-Q(34) synthetase GluQRS [Betaproteobacteria bacterium]
MTRPYRGRFAPTPSGPLHFGSMIAAIGSFCDARASGGSWLVRIDDIDTPRVVPGVADDILRTLEAFTLEWDGRAVYESQNRDAFHGALHSLRTAGHVFACSCSRREISEAGVAGPEGRVYPGTCRHGLRPGGSVRSLRLRVEEESATGFADALQGPISQDLSAEVGDFVVYRSDSIFSYHLACVVGDAHQSITHVVRGADLIGSTPRQIYLQRLLNLPTPCYLHLPVATNSHGEKLSKQTRATPVDPARAGQTIYAVLAFLGQQPPAELANWSARDAMEWAVNSWRRENLPAAAAIELPLPYQSTDKT